MSGFQTFPFAPVRNAVSHLFVDVGACQTCEHTLAFRIMPLGIKSISSIKNQINQ